MADIYTYFIILICITILSIVFYLIENEKANQKVNRIFKEHQEEILMYKERLNHVVECFENLYHHDKQKINDLQNKISELSKK